VGQLHPPFTHTIGRLSELRSLQKHGPPNAQIACSGAAASHGDAASDDASKVPREAIELEQPAMVKEKQTRKGARMCAA
jgi:hypothetical protein